MISASTYAVIQRSEPDASREPDPEIGGVDSDPLLSDSPAGGKLPYLWRGQTGPTSNGPWIPAARWRVGPTPRTEDSIVVDGIRHRQVRSGGDVVWLRGMEWALPLWYMGAIEPAGLMHALYLLREGDAAPRLPDAVFAAGIAHRLVQGGLASRVVALDINGLEVVP